MRVNTLIIRIRFIIESESVMCLIVRVDLLFKCSLVHRKGTGVRINAQTGTGAFLLTGVTDVSVHTDMYSHVFKQESFVMKSGNKRHETTKQDKRKRLRITCFESVCVCVL